MPCRSPYKSRGGPSTREREENFAAESELRRAEQAAKDEKVRRLRDEEGLAFSVIAERFGLSKGGVKNMYARATAARKASGLDTAQRWPATTRSSDGAELLEADFDDGCGMDVAIGWTGNDLRRISSGSLNRAWDEL